MAYGSLTQGKWPEFVLKERRLVFSNNMQLFTSYSPSSSGRCHYWQGQTWKKDESRKIEDQTRCLLAYHPPTVTYNQTFKILWEWLMDILGHKSKIFVPQHPYWLFLLFALPRLHWPESTAPIAQCSLFPLPSEKVQGDEWTPPSSDLWTPS